jgi:phytanoyl-CoA hydroxylase
MMHGECFSDNQWEQYQRDGYLKLGKVLDDGDLAALQRRIDDIMLGQAKIDYERVMMQLDSDSGRYEDTGVQSRGFKRATLDYRKVQDLELDSLFLSFMQRPLFREICARVYGDRTPISSFRAMFMNKPSKRGTILPWHQDRWRDLDRDPLLTVWTALDPATIENGCVQVIPGTHQQGIINPEHGSGFLTGAQSREHRSGGEAAHLELAAGEAMILHNWLLHSSDVNQTDQSRRAFSVCYMDARAVSAAGHTFPRIFGPGALTPGM